MEGIRGRTGSDQETRPGRSAAWPRFRRSLSYALHGVRYAFSHHPNLRLELALFTLSFTMALILAVPPMLIVLSWGFVMSFEFINTAVELIVDLVSPEYHPLAGLAKDVSAGAVLVAAATTAIVNAWLLLPALISRFGLVNSSGS